MRVSECGRKIRNANRVPKSDDRTESNLRRGGREGGKVGGRQGGGEGWGGERGERGEGRGERGEGRGERGEGRGEEGRGGVAWKNRYNESWELSRQHLLWF